jgi:hypothetical protein
MKSASLGIGCFTVTPMGIAGCCNLTGGSKWLELEDLLRASSPLR